MFFFLLCNVQSAFLEVVIPPDIVSEETSGDLMVPEGSSAKLTCKARGYPKPDIVWRREDRGDIIVRDTNGGAKTRRNVFSFQSYFLFIEIIRCSTFQKIRYQKLNIK